MADRGQRFTPGDRVLLFLVPDEYGLAQFRPAMWGHGVLAVRDQLLQPWPGTPLLSDVRALLARQQAPQLPDPNAAGGGDDGALEVSAREQVLLVVSVVAALALVSALAWRRSRGGRG